MSSDQLRQTSTPYNKEVPKYARFKGLQKYILTKTHHLNYPKALYKRDKPYNLKKNLKAIFLYLLKFKNISSGKTLISFFYFTIRILPTRVAIYFSGNELQSLLNASRLLSNTDTVFYPTQYPFYIMLELNTKTYSVSNKTKHTEKKKRQREINHKWRLNIEAIIVNSLNKNVIKQINDEIHTRLISTSKII